MGGDDQQEARLMHRFFVDDAGFQGEVVCLEETDARHARRVLRLRPGEMCIRDRPQYAA